MLDRVKFAIEMANELNKSSFSVLTPVMAEYATAGAVQGIQCGQANMLADVYSTINSTQYSVKTYKDRNVEAYINGNLKKDITYTDFIIERRISGVSDPNADPYIVFREVLDDIIDNENKSKHFYNVNCTETVLLGYSEDIDHFYFRLTETPYEYLMPDIIIEKTFTERNKNYLKHNGNRCSINGYNSNNEHIFEWIHPNNQVYTRCLKKKYNLSTEDSFYFKIKKQQYHRPSDSDLMGMIFI